MKIIVLHPKVCAKSAGKLAEAIGASHENPYVTGGKDYRAYDLVINYGCNRNIKATRLINNTKAVACCVDKLRTFSVLKEAGGINIPEFTTNAAKAKDWEVVVVRQEVDAAGNKGMQFVYPAQQMLPDAPLYTKYFAHKDEYRIVVVPESNGIMSVQAYRKVTNKLGDWELIEDNSVSLAEAKKQCLKAAEALNIDYVGFDVLMNKKKQFVILEANSGPVITDTSIQAFQKLLKNVV